jgi:undecaprenyl-diphosphatase
MGVVTSMLVLGVLLAVGLAAGVLARVLLMRWPVLDPADPAGVVRAVGEEVQRTARASFASRRLDPKTRTGLALTLAIGVVVLGGAILAMLAVVARSNHVTLRIDRGVTTWAGTNATDASTRVLTWLTQLGSSVGVVTVTLVLLGVVAATMPSARRRAVLMAAAYLATVIVGQNLIANVVKVAVDRARPAFHPLAGFSGPSFPSGHTTAAFACWCAFAVVLGRGRGRTVQTWLLSCAIGLAAMIGASRVLLGVHWLTDVVAGAALGLAWFALSTIAFGGRLLRFGAPVIAGERAAELAGTTGAPGATGAPARAEPGGADASAVPDQSPRSTRAASSVRASTRS